MILLDLPFDPPAMSRRAISPTPVESIRLEGKFELILPSNWKPNNRQTVWMHFHGPNWHTRDEHARAGHTEPIIHASAGEGSTVYANLFKDPAVWDRLIVQIGEELRRRSGRRYLKVTGVHLSSFSAGYGAIRELVKLPSAFKMIQSVVLADSFYGSLETMEPRVPYGPHIEVWEPLAREAMGGQEDFHRKRLQRPDAELRQQFGVPERPGAEGRRRVGRRKIAQRPRLPAAPELSKGRVLRVALWRNRRGCPHHPHSPPRRALGDG